MSDRVLITTRDGVADVRLNRADKMNALDAAMFEALVEAGKEVGARRDVRAVVLSGEGRAFCAGLDFTSFASMAGGGERPLRNLFDRSGESPANHAQRAAWVWREVPVPVIAAIHGVAYGGGLQVALRGHHAAVAVLRRGGQRGGRLLCGGRQLVYRGYNHRWQPIPAEADAGT